MNRRQIAVWLTVCLLLVAGLAYGQPGVGQAQGGERRGFRGTPVHGTVAAVDAAKGTIQVTPFRAKEGAAAQTIFVAPNANLYRVTQVQPAEARVGDMLVMRLQPAEGARSPLPLLSGTGQVTNLNPLTLKISENITVTVQDATGLFLQRWAKINLGEVAVGDRINAIGQEVEGRLTCDWLQVGSAAPPRAREGGKRAQ